jgi:hypothetical protein
MVFDGLPLVINSSHFLLQLPPTRLTITPHPSDFLTTTTKASTQLDATSPANCSRYVQKMSSTTTSRSKTKTSPEKMYNLRAIEVVRIMVNVEDEHTQDPSKYSGTTNSPENRRQLCTEAVQSFARRTPGAFNPRPFHISQARGRTQ